MTIKTPITMVGTGPNWALEDADRRMIATIRDPEIGEALTHAANLVFAPKLKPKADVIVRKVASLEKRA